MNQDEFQERVLNELAEIKKEIGDLKRTCSRMDAHVSFVETTYDRVRSPFNWILNRVGYASGAIEVEPLQQIENIHSKDGDASKQK